VYNCTPPKKGQTNYSADACRLPGSDTKPPDRRIGSPTGSQESGGRNELFVQSFPVGSGKFQISSAGGVQPPSRRDGQELFYIAADGKLMAVNINVPPHFQAGTPKALFGPGIWGGGVVNCVFRYDVTADGKRFLVNKTRDQEDTTVEPFTVMLNCRRRRFRRRRRPECGRAGHASRVSRQSRNITVSDNATCRELIGKWRSLERWRPTLASDVDLTVEVKTAILRSSRFR
jgi:hypothetical protein